MTVVCYRLAVIVFRTGGMTDGHFYIAAPTTAGNWRVLNNSAAQQPVSLKQLQRSEGKHAHASDVETGPIICSRNLGAMGDVCARQGSGYRRLGQSQHHWHVHACLQFAAALSVTQVPGQLSCS